jgi:large subunit ribosomal protein L30|tara:strand:- start:328 stop:531 length:204 start_codon:yes stop_codon:yes gene_type:complete
MVKKPVEHNKYITVTQIASSIGRGKKQCRTLIGLGLTRIGSSRRLIESKSILGMVDKVKHLLKIENL